MSKWILLKVKKAAKLGDSIKEVYSDSSTGRGWYADYNVSIVLAGPWFSRGGNNDNDSAAGVFTSNYLVGRADDIASSHLVFIS